MNLRQNQRYSIKIQRNRTAGKTAILFFLCESEWNEMKKTSITISYDEEKLSALKLYLGQKNSSAENELTKALDMLYAKTVPAGVREFIDLRSGKAPISNTPGKNPKLSPSSAVGTTPSPEVKQDEGR